MEAEGLSKQRAYDRARKEFYKLRQQEEIQRRIAVEEARMYEKWKKWATDEIAALESERSAAYANVVDMAEDKGTSEEEYVD